MPAQKRPLPSSAPEDHLQKQHRHASGDGGGEGGGEATILADLEQIRRAEEEEKVDEENGEEDAAMEEEEEEEEEEEKMEVMEVKEKQEPVLQRCDEQAGSDGEDSGIPSSSSFKDEYIHVKLADIRKEVQCAICLGIIRKTRTVMECLHRFCRECIDKSMRLGNNECPACRTHCASRRSLRDDPNYDALIAALYPDIDRYEQEELAFHEEENNRNKKIQASIAEILRRQTEALGKRRITARAAARKSVNFRRGRNRSFSRDTIQGSDYEDEDADVNDVGKDSSSADERTETRLKKFRRRLGPRLSPALGTSSADGGCDENDDAGGKEMRGASPARVGNRDVLVWGKGAARSQTRHGSGSNGKNAKGNRITRLVDYLRNLDEKENEYDMHLTLLPLDKETVPSLERPYLCCRPTLSIKHICQFIAHETSIHAEEIEILVKKPRSDASASLNCRVPNGQANTLEEELQVLEAQESLSALHAFFSSNPGNLVLVYRAKN